MKNQLIRVLSHECLDIWTTTERYCSRGGHYWLLVYGGSSKKFQDNIHWITIKYLHFARGNKLPRTVYTFTLQFYVQQILRVSLASL